MKRILMVCEAFGGGVFSYVSQLCNDMCDNFEVYLAYSIRSQTPKNYHDFLDKRIKLIEVKSFGKSIFNIYNDIKIIKELRKIKYDVNPDIIHLHSSIAGAFGRIAFDGKDCSVVYTPHGYAHILMGDGIKSKIYYLAEKYLGKGNSITLTCCESEDEESKKFSKKHAYIETGVNIKDLENSLNGIEAVKNNKFTVFTLGRACVQKQPEIFNKIAELVPDAQFYWIGNGELENELTASNITITGWKPRKEALAMAKGADVFILCSLGEAIAMSLIENMFIKKLCLVSNKIGNKSVIHDGINGYICDSPEEYAKHIREAMKSFPYKLVDKAYNDVLNIYNTDVMKEKYIKFYNNLIY